ncbi:MAG: tRNA dihydrouridine(20/20a) synthase DusA [Pseudomonadales bacterium]|nr:tRNA dihydrouridine(20/20a) synthase DusA [Pseudomonadales bacterium]
MTVSHLDRTLSVAPMMGCTDRHCRYLLRLIAPNTLLYTEMVTTGALLHGNRDAFLDHAADEPCALQLGGSDPVALAECAAFAEAAGYQEVNLNVGCPSDKVKLGGIGACLMAEPTLVARCISAMQDRVGIPVTAKSRIGIDDADDYPTFRRFIATLYDAGCRVFIVHARKAVLGGLTPKENREIPPLKYDYVYRIKAEFPDAAFILNGGIKSAGDALSLLAGVDGVMLGRAAYSDPFVLADIEAQHYGTGFPDKLAILSTYRDYVATSVASGHHFKHMARHLLGFFTGERGARAFRRHLSQHMFNAGADASIIDDALAVSGLDRAPLTATGT